MTAISPTPALQYTDSVVIHRCPNTKTTFLMGELRANILEEALSIFCAFLKVPKRENFSLAFFTLSEPIGVCDLGTGTKIDVFIN
jgi:hypothetical protein